MAEIDRGQIIRGKYDLDVVGHYARPDIFQLHVDERPKQPVTGGGVTAGRRHGERNASRVGAAGRKRSERR